MAEQLIGKVTHYFGKAKVAAIEITDGALCLGDTIHVLGHTSDFTHKVESMQVDHDAVEKAGKGDHVGIRIMEHAREHDQVFLVIPD